MRLQQNVKLLIPGLILKSDILVNLAKCIMCLAYQWCAPPGIPGADVGEKRKEGDFLFIYPCNTLCMTGRYGGYALVPLGHVNSPSIPNQTPGIGGRAHQ